MIAALDHLVLTTADLQACLGFYRDLLGLRVETFGQGRHALHFGAQKINIHLKGQEFEPKAHVTMPGALDLCFIADRPLDEVIGALQVKGARIIEGPVRRTGATGPLRSIYLRDPDRNLIEISERVS